MHGTCSAAECQTCVRNVTESSLTETIDTESLEDYETIERGTITELLFRVLQSFLAVKDDLDSGCFFYQFLAFVSRLLSLSVSLFLSFSQSVAGHVHILT